MRLLLCTLVVVSLFGARAQERDSGRNWLRQAEKLFEQHRWEQAREAATKALALDPGLTEAELLLGLVATARSNFSEAEKHFGRAVSLEPASFRAHAYLGSTYLQEKRLAEASRSFQKVLQLNPGNATAHYNLGAIALADGKPASGLAHFEAAHRADASDVPASLGILESQLLLRRTAESRQTARRLDAALGPSDPRLLHVAALLAVHGDCAGAIPILEKMLRATPASREVSYNLSLAYFRSGQYDKAAEVLQPLLDAPHAAEAYDLLGAAEEQRNRLPEAIRAYRRAAELEPASEDYRFDYANALLQHQSVQASLTAFVEAAREFPKSWRMRLGLGSACYMAGDYQRAAQALLEAAALKPDSKLAYLLLGKAYESAQSLQAAIAERFRSYLARRPDDAWAYYHYGVILYQRAVSEDQSDFSQAKAHLKKALALDPNLAPAHLQLGIIAQAEGRVEESLGFFERAVQLDPKLPADHYRLALAYQKLGQGDKARIEMERFEALKAEGEGAQDRRAVFESLARQAR
jgi:tetratricopeptide (TPR) repeat protein